MKSVAACATWEKTKRPEAKNMLKIACLTMVFKKTNRGVSKKINSVLIFSSCF